jgi:predicted nucleic acid-binding protein
MQWKNMVNRVYVDTNIFIDLLDATRPFAKDTSNVIRKMIMNGTLLYINSDTVTNTFYVLSKQKKYTQKELLGLMRKSVSIFMIVSVEYEDVTDAITLCEDENTAFKDYEDALQYVCAKKVDVELILTNDRGFMSKDIEVKSTNELSLD